MVPLNRMAEQLHLKDMIRFLGWIEKFELVPLYRGADIFVFPSLDESMPNVVMEAMASGLPLVISDIAAHRALIEHGKNGLLVPVKDSPALADAITRLVGEESLRRLCRAENPKKIEKYSWRNIYPLLEQFKM